MAKGLACALTSMIEAKHLFFLLQIVIPLPMPYWPWDTSHSSLESILVLCTPHTLLDNGYGPDLLPTDLTKDLVPFPLVASLHCLMPNDCVPPPTSCLLLPMPWLWTWSHLLIYLPVSTP